MQNTSPFNFTDLATAIPMAWSRRAGLSSKTMLFICPTAMAPRLPARATDVLIGPGETAREVAVRLLRWKARSRPSRPFDRPLRYGRTGWM